MTAFPRLVPYVWPHRRKFYYSVVFSLLVAGFWGLSLSSAYPIVTVLFENKSVEEYVDDAIATTKTVIDKKEKTLDEREDQLKKLEGQKVPLNRDLLKMMRRQSTEQSVLSSASYKLVMLSWLKARVVPRLPHDKFNLLALILGAQMLLTLAKGSCEFVQETLIAQLVELSLMGVRKDCFRRVLRLDYQSVTMKGTPKLMSHFTNDMNVMASGLRLMGGKVIQEPLKALACIVLAFFVCWQLTLLSLLTAPILAIIFARIGSSLRRASHRAMDSMTRVYKTLEETFDGYKVVTAFNAARRHRRRFHRDSKDYCARSVKIARIDALTGPVTETMAWIAALLALLPGCYLVLRGTTDIWGIRLSTGQLGINDLGTLYVLLAGIIDPARKLSSTYAKLKRASAAADRIFEMMNEKTRVEEPATPKVVPRLSRSIEFSRIHFAYARTGPTGVTRPAALDDVSLSIKAGEVIAVVGENGSGKSTLVNLLPRLYDPDFGTITIDGVNIRDVRLEDLRNQIGIVTQETLLFDDTIYENILYGKSGAKRAEVEEAARRAYVTRFFDQMPDGFQTRIGEKGGRLSGGQRQRIALARAMLRDPAILILDEATSATDAQSEMLIHEALQSFVKGRTTFLITHAVTPSVLELVHKIAVMDHGQLVAFGPHEELLANCPAYERLFHARGRRVHVSADLQESAEDRDEEASTFAGNTATHDRIDSDHSIERLEILPLPLARSIRLAAQSTAGEPRAENAREASPNRSTTGHVGREESHGEPARPSAAGPSLDAA
ncbi:MAG TPA: ABC transporter ATP-binding protein [Planctomycetaceae bacterium]|nr:ABC transporter ATP-binding protein [Planctomycetaceae bacterium]